MNENDEPFKTEVIAYLAEILAEGLIALEAEKRGVQSEEIFIDFDA